MVNENNINQEPEADDIHRLLSGLKRVEAPTDFDFHVRARIAKGRPAEKRSSWFSPAVGFAIPLVLVIAIGGYFGLRTLDRSQAINSQDVAKAPVVETPSQSAPLVPTTNPGVNTVPPSEVVAERTEARPIDTPEKTGQKRNPKGGSTPDTDKSGGAGSYVEAAKTPEIRTPKGDIDDNAPVAPDRKLLISTRDFLTQSGVSATYAGAGGKIISVGAAASAAGVRAGDVIEGVNVQAGTIRVQRDGKSLTFTIR